MIHFAHVGLFKTASTWLQSAVFAAHPQLVVVGAQPDSPVARVSTNLLVLEKRHEFDPERHRAVFRDEIARHGTSSARVVGISNEALAGHMITGYGAGLVAERLREVFGRIKIFLVLRHPFDYIRSMYNQYVKQGGALPLRALLADATIPGKAIPRRVDFPALVETYHDVFGPANVLVLPFELLKEDPERFLAHLWDFLEVEPIGPTQFLASTRNPSLSPPALGIMRLCNYRGYDRRHTRRVVTTLDRVLRLRTWWPVTGSPRADALLGLKGGPEYPGFANFLKNERFKLWDGELARFNYTFPVSA